MARFSFSESCTSRTVDGPRVQRTRRISSSDAVGFCGGCFMREPYYEDVRSVNENLRRLAIFVNRLRPKQIARNKQHISRALAQPPHEVGIPFRAEGNVNPKPQPAAHQFPLQSA